MPRRSNSWNLSPFADVPRASGEACPLSRDEPRLAEVLAGVRPERLAFLRFKDRMRLFASDTHDFDDAELARGKALGQLYMDVSHKLAPDDFSADLRKVTLDAECEGCALRGRCAGAFHAMSEDVFARDARHVSTILERLEGSVLDVGAGHAPYAAVLEPAVHAKRVHYLALDPDATRLALLASRYVWAETRRGTLEDLAREGARFDHVLLLRSYNHLPEPGASLRVAVDLLEPGGTLLVVDDVAFGLLRSREQIERAVSGPAAFEHWANASAEDAHSEIAPLGLELFERHDVTVAGSNQWLLHYRKPKAT